MPGGTWFGIETARRGMNVHQQALDITGHNLANASTPGYSRQEAVIKASSPYTSPDINTSVTPGQFGTGSLVEMIRRVKDEYLDNNVRQATTDYAYWNEQISFHQRAEALFAEPAGAGIGQRIVDFFKAWMDLNNTPQDSGIKAAVVQVGDELAALMSSTYSQLTDIQNSIYDSTNNTGKMYQLTTQINNLLSEISSLSETIKKITSLGQQPNDLLDLRDQKLEQLSEIGPVTLTEDPLTGNISNLTFFGINIDLQNLSQFSLEIDINDDILLRYNKTPAEDFNLTANAGDYNLGGGLLGAEKARQDIIDYKDRLGEIAKFLYDNIQDVGVATFYEGDLASGTFKVNQTLNTTPALLDGTRARAMANLRDKDMSAAIPYNLEEYFSELVTVVGNKSKTSDGLAANNQAIKQQITSLRDSVSGVSTDEELTKMIQFQYGYMASARMINTIDGMLDVVINRLSRG
ncbi:flagellar hook-associated protein FlgK [Desulforamulus ferrireducens]|uniref:Flagellar hook-associated protein 1 n=1 Tax=Desulforamulus ferrireducens TaxID=1833852 RepID=A0A1S6IYK5_9FIRM|nr:flagellar hook-associated protein FlgK [Desulforamulus ferrireducens]AQS59848.1 flagellar hook-associated protein FlgK [Desulforamulus ferrireducens]